ncbi:hypothetical protein LWI29_010716 [Acer saccharum]|uniref:Protein FAR1-RELATED SEQUENCE n=1 Tax=Acer saccharum TaxID=4024 RepID=A0AA39RCF9_ACESA|nr:hypothetical protein LWI29_010716 [Acer saccharum]
MDGSGSQSKPDNKEGLFFTPNNMCSTGVNSVQFSSWEGSGNQDVDINQIKNMKFDSMDDARSFYLGYARGNGFGIRATNLDHDREGRVLRRKWVCDKQGSRREEYLTNKDRKRKPRLQTRQNCKACFSIGLDSDTLKYSVRVFMDDHSHKLATFREVSSHRSHRNLDEGDYAQIDDMGKNCIRGCQTFEYMVDQKGGYSKIGFTQKDMYNKIAKLRRSKAFESDSQAAISYLESKAFTEANFYCRFNTDDDDRLANIFWRDSNSLFEYKCFGDVLVFDTTYKTNAYGKPLVLFVGVNNHSATCVFGAALLLDETFTSYKWALTKLMDSMGIKHPLSIMTDGDEAMRQVIDEVFPNCQHRVCGWHVARNACAHINGPKKSSAFRSFIFDHIDEDKFDECWNEMIKQHGLEDNVWVNMMYEKRHRWAETYSKGHFFAGMRSTQRSESMNNYMKEYVCSREKLFDLFPQIDRALMRLRNNFFTDEYASNTKSPVILSHMKALEKHASSIYTYRIYCDITKEINDSIKYSHFAPWNEENEVEYVLTEYDSPYKKTVSVFYYRDRIDFQQVVEDGDWDSSKHNLLIG